MPFEQVQYAWLLQTLLLNLRTKFHQNLLAERLDSFVLYAGDQQQAFHAL
jgi:hypothetical protein